MVIRSRCTKKRWRWRRIFVFLIDALFVGGGNTFCLLQQCRERGLLEQIRERVRAGIPYIGWSAGANLACPSIATKRGTLRLTRLSNAAIAISSPTQ